MRRPLLVVLGLCLLGLSAAMAANHANNAEDIESFTTQVSVSVPSTSTTVAGPMTLPPVIYLVGDGSISFVVPNNNNTTTKRLNLESNNAVTPLAQADPNKFFTFASAPAPSGYLLQGYFHLNLEQDEAGNHRFTALLLDCPDLESSASAGCTQIAIASADAITPPGGNGFKDRVAHFGFVDHTIPAGRDLRVKVVNQRENPPGLVVSTVSSFRISYGYNPARPSSLTRTANP